MKKAELLHTTLLILAVLTGYTAMQSAELLRVTIGAFLMYAAPTLANFIEKTIAARLDSASQTR